MRFLIDTDICSYAIARRPAVLAHWANYRRGDMVISAVSEAELRFGAAKNRSRIAMDELDEFLRPYEILEFSRAHTTEYGELKAVLERRGQRIGDNDMLIAAQAVATDLILVTNNEREFRRVPGLKIENWAA
ncbi:MAG TPA: type II toxin-antitoxin system VapC family toxin [Kofleriaceae bacterium]|jgi:tRNA(fMet)-specific endonuclease VapC|nr:type II toxin-antitoxin system VapC family toxin [Kofleriaceae bacterium]